MGVCPQNNNLFDTLTVQEHLELFANLKGMNPKDIRNAVDKMITDLDLFDKRNDQSKDLSGGQKRKLSVGIAFIGDSEIVILDEPTSVINKKIR